MSGGHPYVDYIDLRLLDCRSVGPNHVKHTALRFVDKLSTFFVGIGLFLLLIATYEFGLFGRSVSPPGKSGSSITVVDASSRSSIAQSLPAAPNSTSEIPPQERASDEDATKTTRDAALRAAEQRLPVSWDVTETLHRRFKDERRVEAWASGTEDDLRSASQNLPSLKILSADSTPYCAATICEVVITTSRPGDVDAVNLMANDLQSREFDQALADHGLSLASISMTAGDQDHQGIVMQIKKN